MPSARLRIRRPAPVTATLRKLGERVRKARAEAGLSQAQLGAPHFTRAYVSAIELGKVRPAMKSLEFMADKLGKPVSYFVEDEGTERRRRERELEIRSAEALVSRTTANQALEKAQSLLETATTPAERCRLHLIAGSALNHMVRGPEALRELTAAERLQSAATPEMLSRIRYQTALAFRQSGNPSRAIELLRELLHDLDRSPVPYQPLRLRVVKDLGVILTDSGDYDAAGSYLVQALEWAQDIGDVAGLVTIYHALGYAYRALGDLDAAIGYIQKALAMNEAAEDLTAAAMLHTFLAVVAADRGHFHSAQDHVDRAIQIARASGPAFNLPHYISTKAECEFKEKHYDVARQYATEALDAANAVDNKRAAAAARLVLSDVDSAVGEHARAQKQLEEAAALYKSVDAKAELGDAYMRLSKLASTRGNAADAQRYADLAFKTTKRTSALVER